MKAAILAGIKLSIMNVSLRRGYGERLLKFAVSYLQKNKISPIRLYVADWNQGALKMYIKNGFKITHTEIIN